MLGPLDKTKPIILGVLSRAQERTGMRVVALTVLSTHYHLLLQPDSNDQMSEFMHYFNGNVARELNALHGWRGPFWDGRYKHHPVASTEEDQVSRLRYQLSQGLKENLVERVEDWPGIHAGLLWEERSHREGLWYDRTQLYERRRSGREVGLEEVAERRTVELAPLPCWADLPPEEVRERIRSLVSQLEEEHRERRLADGKTVLGAERLLAVSPLSRARDRERTPVPPFFARSRSSYEALRDASRQFYEDFRRAAERLKAGIRPYGFPPGSFPPGLPFVPHEAPG